LEQGDDEINQEAQGEEQTNEFHGFMVAEGV
jgi:hypothetical protein